MYILDLLRILNNVTKNKEEALNISRILTMGKKPVSIKGSDLLR